MPEHILAPAIFLCCQMHICRAGGVGRPGARSASSKTFFWSVDRGLPNRTLVLRLCKPRKDFNHQANQTTDRSAKFNRMSVVLDRFSSEFEGMFTLPIQISSLKNRDQNPSVTAAGACKNKSVTFCDTSWKSLVAPVLERFCTRIFQGVAYRWYKCLRRVL